MPESDPMTTDWASAYQQITIQQTSKPDYVTSQGAVAQAIALPNGHEGQVTVPTNVPQPGHNNASKK